MQRYNELLTTDRESSFYFKETNWELSHISDGFFVSGRFRYENLNRETDKENTSHWQTDELQGKVGQCFLSDGKVGPQAVSGKIILTALRYFSRKPCLTGSISRNALVVQRTAKVRVLTI